MTSKTILITGCSSGIGWETAKHLAQRGHTVYATARRTSAIAELTRHGCRILALDVTDEASCQAAVAAIEEPIDVLINNAGVNLLGAIESVDLDNVRDVFETNVFGAVGLIQLVAPQMRERGDGRIVTVGSMNGRFTFPGMGHYCATKHALEAIHDALRHELRPFGVDVSLIQPGFVKTPFGKTAAKRFSQSEDGPYARFNEQVAHTAATYQDGPNGLLAATPESVAATIAKAVERRRRPRARYRVAPSAGIMLTTRKLLPNGAFEAFVRTQMPSPEG